MSPGSAWVTVKAKNLFDINNKNAHSEFEFQASNI